MACTATATPAVATEINERLGLREPLIVRSGFDRPNLSFDIVPFEGKGSKARKLALLEHGLKQEEHRPAIVYAGTRRDTEEIAEALRGAGLLAAGYHAGMDPDERASAQLRFMEGDADVIVATNAFGMGIDKANVRSVWHWAIPTSVEAYYQEAGRAGRDGLPARGILLAGRSDLGRLVRFIKQRAVDPQAVATYVRGLRAAADPESGAVEMDNPRDEGKRIRLAIAEREGCCELEPAPGGRLRVTVVREPDPARTSAACRVAQDRGWRAYRAVEAFSFSEHCRRRSLLDHFGDSTAGAASGRCCDVCEGETGLPDPETIAVSSRRGKGRKAAAPPPQELSEGDAALFERLKAWRLEAAAGKPAYTVANDRTLAAIAGTRPAGREALAELHGVGPAFLSRHAEAVLALLAAEPAPSPRPGEGATSATSEGSRAA
jgi:superfamily II DNA helicase RecQ